jgi:hypothetical protein
VGKQEDKIIVEQYTDSSGEPFYIDHSYIEDYIAFVNVAVSVRDETYY